MFAASLIPIRTFSPSENTLPMVEAVFDLFHGITFENACVIGAQHILPTTLQMFLSFFPRGLEPGNVFLIGKCYSTDGHTFKLMQDIGINVCLSSQSFKQGISFDELYQINIRNFLIEVKNKILSGGNKFKKIIILDDGGKLIRNLIDTFDCYAINMIGVEQTTAGYEELKQIKLSFPVVNVARSKTKLQFESPIIASTLAQQLYSKLGSSDFSKKRMLIAGNGAIGKAMFRVFKKNFKVDCFDTTPGKSSIELKNLKNELCEFDLIIGCTGKTFLNFSDSKFLKKGSVLISASSSDREFAAYEFQKGYKGHLDCHDDFEVDGIKIINCGFPVNFGNDASITDPPVFQLTRSLLSGAILSALVKDYPNTFITLNESLQNYIMNNYLNLYR